jgi:hypothetical protein
MDPMLTLPPAVVPLDETLAATVRDLTLNEGFDSYGRLIQRLGTMWGCLPGPSPGVLRMPQLKRRGLVIRRSDAF